MVKDVRKPFFGLLAMLVLCVSCKMPDGDCEGNLIKDSPTIVIRFVILRGQVIVKAQSLAHAGCWPFRGSAHGLRGGSSPYQTEDLDPSMKYPCNGAPWRHKSHEGWQLDLWGAFNCAAVRC